MAVTTEQNFSNRHKRVLATVMALGSHSRLVLTHPKRDEKINSVIEELTQLKAAGLAYDQEHGLVVDIPESPVMAERFVSLEPEVADLQMDKLVETGNEPNTDINVGFAQTALVLSIAEFPLEQELAMPIEVHNPHEQKLSFKCVGEDVVRVDESTGALMPVGLGEAVVRAALQKDGDTPRVESDLTITVTE